MLEGLVREELGEEVLELEVNQRVWMGWCLGVVGCGW